MIINHKYKFMFFAEPHTASRACSRMLESIESSELVGEHHMTHKAGVERGILPAAGYVRFAVIRDPRDIIAGRIARMVNTSKQMGDGPSRSELIERYVAAHCVRRNQFEHDYVDYKIRYDKLEPMLYSLLGYIGVDPIPTLGRNPYETTKNKEPWWEYFSEEQLQRIYENIPEVEQFKVSHA